MDGAIARAEQSVDDADLPEGLNRREYDILAFERQWWKYAGAKEEAIKELFSMSATRYYQVLNTLVDRPEALAADPMLVKRLRRLRASRQKARAARRLGFEAMQYNFVLATNARAIETWRRAGFAEIGRIPRAFRLPGGAYTDALILHRFL